MKPLQQRRRISTWGCFLIMPAISCMGYVAVSGNAKVAGSELLRECVTAVDEELDIDGI